MAIEAHLTDIAHVIQLAVAPVFLLTGVGTIINALNARLTRIIDRRRVLEERMEAPDKARATAVRNELHLLARAGSIPPVPIVIDSPLATAATVFMIRSLPTSFGLSIRTETPVRTPGSTISAGTPP